MCSGVSTEAREDMKTERKNKRLAKNKAARISRKRRMLKKRGRRDSKPKHAHEDWDGREGWDEHWDEGAEGWGQDWDAGAEGWEAWKAWYEDGPKSSKNKKAQRQSSAEKRLAPAEASPGPKTAKRSRVTASNANNGDSAMINDLLKVLWYYSDHPYPDTGLEIHAQRWTDVRLNIYWTRLEVGVTIKKYGGTNKPKDVCHFSSPTSTIATHLFMANIVVFA